MVGVLALVATWFGGEIQARTGIDCTFSAKVDDDLLLDGKKASAVFRIFQEILTNVARHSNATKVDISLHEETDQLVLKVRDNGRGVTENERYDLKSLGILGMRERTLLLGGEFNIKGVPNEGTTVTVRIPLGLVVAGGAENLEFSGAAPFLDEV